MRWIKYTLIGLAGILLVCCALIVTVVYLFDDGYYRNALVAVVEHQTGDRLKIEGPFKLHLALHPRLDASQIRLESDTDEYDVKIGKVLVEIELMPQPTSTESHHSRQRMPRSEKRSWSC